MVTAEVLGVAVDAAGPTTAATVAVAVAMAGAMAVAMAAAATDVVAAAKAAVAVVTPAAEAATAVAAAVNTAGVERVGMHAAALLLGVVVPVLKGHLRRCSRATGLVPHVALTSLPRRASASSVVRIIPIQMRGPPPLPAGVVVVSLPGIPTLRGDAMAVLGSTRGRGLMAMATSKPTSKEMNRRIAPHSVRHNHLASSSASMQTFR